MSKLEEIPQTYLAAVQTLAEWHTGEDLPDLEVYSFPDPLREVVRLLEISDGFPSTGKAVAYPFGKSCEFPFKSQVIQVTKDEWEQVLQGKLSLPSGWDLTARERVCR